MFGTAIIVFREVLEAAIIIGILAAATREVPKRNHWLAAGVLAGLAGSSIVASSTEAIANLASGIGQELFNAIVLGVAVLMLAWHNIWMSSHGKELAANAKKVGKSIVDGMQQSSILLTVVGLAVLREGSETVLFLFGMATTQTASSTITGALAGLGAGAAVGYALYAGLLRVPMRWFFAATSGLVLLLAAGMASNATKFLIQADVLPSLTTPLWDTSGIIAQNGITGTLLHSLIGYDARPAGMQVIVYIAVLLAIWLGMQYANKPKQPFTPMLSGQY
jgi:high-affinity iron transporter